MNKHKEIKIPKLGMSQPYEANLYNIVVFVLCDHLEFGVGLPITWQLEEVFDKDLATRVTDG